MKSSGELGRDGDGEKMPSEGEAGRQRDTEKEGG